MQTIDSNFLSHVTGGAKTGPGGLTLGQDACPVQSPANVSRARAYLSKTHQRYSDLKAGYKGDPLNQYNYAVGNRCDPDAD